MLHHLHAAATATAASSSSCLGIIPQQRICVCNNNGQPTNPRTSSPRNLYLPPPHVDFISSPSNPFVKHCLKLRLSSSYRHSHAAALLVGLTPISEMVRFQASQEETQTSVDCIFLLDGSELPGELFDFPVRAVHVSSAVMKKLAGLQSVDSTVAVALMRFPATFHRMDDDDDDDERAPDCEHWFPSPHRVLVLDGIQDPGNLGTLLRSAMAFGWDGVFLLPGCCDPFNEKALRAARGACFQLSIVSGSWDHLETFREKFEVKMLAGDPDDTIQGKAPILLSPNFVNSITNKHLCLVLGSEGKGLSMEAKNACELVTIPMAESAESLNVSVAGGIFLYELQRHKKKIL